MRYFDLVQGLRIHFQYLTDITACRGCLQCHLIHDVQWCLAFAPGDTSPTLTYFSGSKHITQVCYNLYIIVPRETEQAILGLAPLIDIKTPTITYL